jgi:hypothetical protein
VAPADRLDRQTASNVTPYCSTMCSTVSEQLARIGQAIDELAAESAGTETAETAETASLDDRLARIWLMMAELDPQLASRITSYGSAQ